MSGGSVKRTTIAVAITVTFLLIVLVPSAWTNPADDQGQIIFTSYASQEVLFDVDGKFACRIPAAGDSGLSLKFSTKRGEHAVVAHIGDQSLEEMVHVEDDISFGYGDPVYQGACQVSPTNAFSCWPTQK